MALYALVNDRIDPADRDEYLAQHIGYLGELHEAGQVLLAGPFTDMGTALNGFALFASTDQEEVQHLADADPAVGTLLSVTVHSWTALWALSGCHVRVSLDARTSSRPSTGCSWKASRPVIRRRTLTAPTTQA